MTDDLSLLVTHLQERIKDLKNTQKIFRSNAYNMRYTMTRLLDNATKSFTKEEYVACAKICLYDHTDRVNNSEYLQRYYPDYWERIGILTEYIKSECIYNNENK